MADRNGYIGRAPADSAVTVARQSFTPTGVTTDFTFASGYVPGYFDLFINGIKMIEGSDYTSTDGSTFSVLNGGAQNGDVLEGVAYKAFNAATASVGIYSGGDPISTQANILNFVGTGNTFALRGSTVDISISGGAGAGGTWANYDTNTGVSTTKKVKIENDLEVTGVTTSTTFSGNITGVAATFSGDLSADNITVSGTLTYEDVTNIDSLGIITARSHVSIADSILHTGDTDTAIRFPAADTFTVETAGSERVRVTGIGSVGIGTDNPTAKFEVHSDTIPRINTVYQGSKHFGMSVGGSGGGFVLTDGHFMTVNHQPYADRGTDNNLTERFRITSTGEVRVGSAFSVSQAGVCTAAEFHGDGSNLTGVSAGITTEAGTASGIVTHVRLSSAQDHKITATGITTITSSGSGTEGESHTIRIVNSGIATVGFSTYFLFPSGAAPTLPTADGAISLISFTVHDSVGAGCTQLLAGASVNYS